MARFLNPTVNTSVVGTLGNVSTARASPAGLMQEIRPGCPTSFIAGTSLLIIPAIVAGEGCIDERLWVKGRGESHIGKLHKA